MRVEHERYYGLGIDALIVGCTRNIFFFAWMLCQSHPPKDECYYCLGRDVFDDHTRQKMNFILLLHGSFDHRMYVEHEHYGSTLGGKSVVHSRVVRMNLKERLSTWLEG